MMSKRLYIFHVLTALLIVITGCGYTATIGRPGDEPESTKGLLEIDGYRLKSGYFRIIAGHSGELTGEARIVKTKKEEYYLFLSDNFKIEDVPGNMLYVSSNPILHAPTDMTDKFLLGTLQNYFGFQYYELKNEYNKWLDGNFYQSVAIYNSISGFLIGYVHLYKTEPYEENLWVRTHSTVY